MQTVATPPTDHAASPLARNGLGQIEVLTFGAKACHFTLDGAGNVLGLTQG